VNYLVTNFHHSGTENSPVIYTVTYAWLFCEVSSKIPSSITEYAVVYVPKQLADTVVLNCQEHANTPLHCTGSCFYRTQSMHSKVLCARMFFFGHWAVSFEPVRKFTLWLLSLFQSVKLCFGHWVVNFEPVRKSVHRLLYSFFSLRHVCS